MTSLLEFEAENQRFPASFSYKAIFSKLKNDQNASLPRLLTLCQVCAALTLRFTKTASSPHHKMLRLPTNCRMQQHKVLRLPQKRHASIDTLPKYIRATAGAADLWSWEHRNPDLDFYFLQGHLPSEVGMCAMVWMQEAIEIYWNDRNDVEGAGDFMMQEWLTYDFWWVVPVLR